MKATQKKKKKGKKHSARKALKGFENPLFWRN